MQIRGRNHSSCPRSGPKPGEADPDRQPEVLLISSVTLRVHALSIGLKFLQ